MINEYAFARSGRLIEDPAFGKVVTDNLLMGTHMGPMIKHMNWALTLVNALPESVSGRVVPGTPRPSPKRPSPSEAGLEMLTDTLQAGAASSR